MDKVRKLSQRLPATNINPIKHLINTSLKTTKYANKWKLAKLVPLLKSNDLNKLLPSSYRPIAILPMISKLVERGAQTQLLGYMEEHKLLKDNYHAYRKGYCMTTTLLELTDKIFDAIDEKKMSSLMTIDQSAAFDCVPHQLLLQKLKIYNLSDSALHWISSYLEYRVQFVIVGRAESRMNAIDRGVPQGSVLGPLLYSIFTNEMSKCIRDNNYTDNTHIDTEKLFGADCKRCR